jgi:flavin reductase (DIM6/NTAB) family NADH-FMN oxidoreductase RutF
MQPKRMMVSIYHGTQTLENVKQDKAFVLQLLDEGQYNLVNLLGKQSGKKIDKISRLAKRKLVTEWQGYPVLQQSLAVMLLHVVEFIEAGDHRMYLCDVVGYKNLNEGHALTTGVLGKKGVIRI